VSEIDGNVRRRCSHSCTFSFQILNVRVLEEEDDWFRSAGCFGLDGLSILAQEQKESSERYGTANLLGRPS
jgi:hypothetical protein